MLTVAYAAGCPGAPEPGCGGCREVSRTPAASGGPGGERQPGCAVRGLLWTDRWLFLQIGAPSGGVHITRALWVGVDLRALIFGNSQIDTDQGLGILQTRPQLTHLATSCLRSRSRRPRTLQDAEFGAG